MTDRIKGHLFANQGEVAVRLEMESSSGQARVTVRPLSRADGSVVASEDRRVARYLKAVHRAIHAEHQRNRPITPILKPGARKRKRSTVAVACPSCHGAEPEVWDCEVCQGGGVVRG